MAAMTTHVSGPGVGDWLAALVRGFHPLRWLLSLVSLLVAAGLHSLMPSALEAAADLRNASVGVLLWAIVLLTASATLACLPGGWIARHELLARRRHDSSLVGGPGLQLAGATTFVRTRWTTLLACCPFVVLFFLLLVLPLLFVIWLSGVLGAVGALAMSVLLPVVLVVDLWLLFVVLGVPAWPLMPIAVAAEGGDVFDAGSRAYSYLFGRPLRFLCLTAVAVALAWLPLRAVLSLFADGLVADRPDLRLAVLFAVAALSLSIFWSLETLVYLHLRAAIDQTDAAELASGALPSDSPAPQPEHSPGQPALPAAPPAPAGLAGALLRLILNVALIAGSWCVTVALFAWVNRGPTDWLDGGWSGWTAGPAGGASWPYLAASFLARLWMVLSLIIPVLYAVRRYLTARAQPQPSDAFVPSAQRARRDESPT